MTSTFPPLVLHASSFLGLCRTDLSEQRDTGSTHASLSQCMWLHGSKNLTTVSTVQYSMHPSPYTCSWSLMVPIVQGEFLLWSSEKVPRKRNRTHSQFEFLQFRTHKKWVRPLTELRTTKSSSGPKAPRISSTSGTNGVLWFCPVVADTHPGQSRSFIHFSFHMNAKCRFCPECAVMMDYTQPVSATIRKGFRQQYNRT